MVSELKMFVFILPILTLLNSIKNDTNIFFKKKKSSCLPVCFKLLSAENRNCSEERLNRTLAGLDLLNVTHGYDSEHV